MDGQELGRDPKTIGAPPTSAFYFDDARGRRAPGDRLGLGRPPGRRAHAGPGNGIAVRRARARCRGGRHQGNFSGAGPNPIEARATLDPSRSVVSHRQPPARATRTGNLAAAHREHRARSQPKHTGRHAPQQEPPETSASVCPDHDQVRVPPSRHAARGRQHVAAHHDDSSRSAADHARCIERLA